MNKKILIFFFISFASTYFLSELFLRHHDDQQKTQDALERAIIIENVSERFKLFLDAPLGTSIVAADYFSKNSIQADYDQLGSNIINRFREILGISILDTNGLIIRVFPESRTTSTRGKISQNYQRLAASLSKQEPYLVSPPVKLYQGPWGFVIYAPIKNAGSLKGWVATVISLDQFKEKFQIAKFLNLYHLIIQDSETGSSYFESAPLPNNLKTFHRNDLLIHNRKISFISWRKDHLHQEGSPNSLSIFFALILSILMSYALHLYIEKSTTKKQLNDLDVMAKLTADQASKSLVDIYRQINLLGEATGYVPTPKVSGYVSFISGLIDQMRNLQKLSNAEASIDYEAVDLLKMIQHQIESKKDLITEKNLRVKYDPWALKDIKIWVNNWLMGNSAFGNIITTALTTAEVGSVIDIEYIEDDIFHNINFLIQDKKDLREESELVIARKVIEFHNGELLLKKTVDGRKISVRLPKQRM